MNIVAALIGVSIALLFIGALAVLIHSVPLTIILVLGGILIIADFMDSLRRRDKEA